MTHRLLRIFTETKQETKIIDVNSDPINIMRQAEKDKKIYCFKKGIYFCIYRTTIDDQDGIMMVFTIKLPNTSTSSSSSTDMIIELVDFLEDTFNQVTFNFSRNIEGINKNVAVLTVYKKISESDIL